MKKNEDNKPVVVHVSFKKTKEDLELYEWLSKKSSKSGYIKDLLKQVKENETNKK